MKKINFYLTLALILLMANEMKVNAQSQPVANNDTIVVYQRHLAYFNPTLNDHDPDGDDLKVYHISNPPNGSASIVNDSTIRYRSYSGYSGWDSLQYKICKVNIPQYFDSAWALIEVIPNELPAVTNEVVQINVGDTLALNVYDHAYDPEGHDFILQTVSDPNNGFATKINDSLFDVSIFNNYSGLDSTRLKLKETGSNEINSGYLLLNISPNMEYPFAVNDTASVMKGDTLFFAVMDNDYDLQGDELEIFDVQQQSGIWSWYWTYDDNLITCVPNAFMNEGFYTAFKYQNREKNNISHRSNIAQAGVYVLPNPNIPVAVNDNVSALAGYPIDIHVLLNDYDINGDDFYIYDVTFNSGFGFISYNDSIITCSPSSYLTNDFSFTYYIRDRFNHAHHSFATVYVDIVPNTNQPIAINDTIEMNSYDEIVFNPLLNDFNPDNTPCSILDIQYGNIGGGLLLFFETIQTGDSLLTFSSYANYEGEWIVKYRFHDINNPSMISNWADIVINISPDMDSLLARNNSVVIYAGMPDTVNVLLNVHNPNNDAIDLFSVHVIDGNFTSNGIYKYGDSTVLVNSPSLYHGEKRVICYFRKNSQFQPPSTFSMLDVKILGRELSASLDINNINAGFTTFGFNFWDGETENEFVSFEVPKGSGQKSIFSSALWIGGIHDDTLHLAAERYRQVGEDFWPGPIADTYPNSELLRFKVWKLHRSEILYHIEHYQDEGYQPIEPILTWPGNGNTSVGQAAQLAPFFDVDGDGIYNPMDGDYPMIRGDQSLYFIFNDAMGIHTETGGQALDVEIHGNAYAFDNPSDSALFNTVFVHYDFINRSNNFYEDSYIAFFNDFDLGYAWDDYIGCDVNRGAAIAYNGVDIDGSGEPESYGANPPVQAMVIFGGPYLENDGLDNPAGGCDFSINGLNFGDGTEDNERYGMTRFVYFNNTSANPNTTDPQVAPEYYNYMQGFWKDNTPHLFGGTAHIYDPMAVGPEARFMFPGASDPLNWGTNCELPNGGYNQNGLYWDEETMGNQPGDRRGVSVTGPFNFNPGETQSVDIAYVFARSFDPENGISPIDVLNERIDTLRARIQRREIIYFPTYNVGITEMINNEIRVSIFPNPMSGNLLNIDLTSLPDNEIMELHVYDLMGKNILAGNVKSGMVNHIELPALQKGIYFISLKSKNYVAVNKLIVH
jgi:hypothetical protein